MVPQPPHPLGQTVVAGGDPARIPVRAQVLARIEAEAAGRADRSGDAPFVPRALRLGRVLDQRQAVLPGQLQQGIHVGRLPVDMHRHDRPGLLRDPFLHLFGIEGEVPRIDVGQDRTRPGLQDRLHRGAEGMRRGDHLVARSDSRADQRQLERIRPVAHPDAVGRPAVPGVRLFERFHLGAEDERTAFDHPGQGRVDLRLDLPVLNRQIVHGYAHLRFPFHPVHRSMKYRTAENPSA